MNSLPATEAANIVPLATVPRTRRELHREKERFTVSEFENESGTKSYRVSGYRRDGSRVRENYADLKAAQCRQIELLAEYHQRQPEESSIRATRLSETQVRIAEAAFMRLGHDDEMLSAVDYWLKHGRQRSVAESPRLDDAVSQFKQWLETTPTLRDRTKANLRLRVGIFGNSVPNLRVSDVTPDTIDAYLGKRAVSPASKDNDRRAVSRFFGWCIERPRRWATVNPCHEVSIPQGDDAPPAVLTVKECKGLLEAAESLGKGRLAPYVAVCLFAGLRPLEAARLTWNAVNLTDGEIRLEAYETKTGRPRVVTICPTLKAWLKAYKGKPFYPSNWRKDFDKVKEAAGYGGRVEEGSELKPWTVDVMRHTAISHYFRQTGSYGQTAEQFGNSEAIIKRHYQGRVSSEDTKAFYALQPTKKGNAR